MGRYAAAIMAKTWKVTSSRAIIINEVSSIDEAVGRAIAIAKAMYPLAEGWADHQASVMLIPDKEEESEACIR